MKSIPLKEAIKLLEQAQEIRVVGHKPVTTTVRAWGAQLFLEIYDADSDEELDSATHEFFADDNAEVTLDDTVMQLQADDGEGGSYIVKLQLLVPLQLDTTKSQPEMEKLMTLLGALKTEIRFSESNEPDNLYALQVGCESVELSRKLAHFYGCPTEELPDLQVFEASDNWHGLGRGDLRELADELGQIYGGFFNIRITGFVETTFGKTEV